MQLRKLSAEEEAAFIKEIHGGDSSAVFRFLRENFALLQARSQMLLLTGLSGYLLSLVFYLATVPS